MAAACHAGNGSPRSRAKNAATSASGAVRCAWAFRRKWTAANGDLLTLEGIVTNTDWAAQTLERTYRYERWRNNSLVETQIDPMIQRFWGQLELQLALEAAGFAVEAVHADYREGAAPGAGTRKLTFEARAV